MGQSPSWFQHQPPTNPVVLSQRLVPVRTTNNKVRLFPYTHVTNIPDRAHYIVGDFLGNFTVYDALMTMNSPNPATFTRAKNYLLQHESQLTDTETFAILAAYAHVSEDVVEEIFDTNVPETITKWRSHFNAMHGTIEFAATVNFDEFERCCYVDHSTDEQFKWYLCNRTLRVELKATIERLRNRASKTKSVYFDFDVNEKSQAYFMRMFAFAGLDLFARNAEVVVATFPRTFHRDRFSTFVTSHRNLRAYYEMSFDNDDDNGLPSMHLIATSFIAGRGLETREIVRDLDFVRRLIWTSWLKAHTSVDVPVDGNAIRIGLWSIYPAVGFERSWTTFDETSVRKHNIFDVDDPNDVEQSSNEMHYDFASPQSPDGKIHFLFREVHETVDMYRAFHARIIQIDTFDTIFVSRRPTNVRRIEYDHRYVTFNDINVRTNHLNRILHAIELPPEPPSQNPLRTAALRGNVSIDEFNRINRTMREAALRGEVMLLIEDA